MSRPPPSLHHSQAALARRDTPRPCAGFWVCYNLNLFAPTIPSTNAMQKKTLKQKTVDPFFKKGLKGTHGSPGAHSPRSRGPA